MTVNLWKLKYTAKLGSNKDICLYFKFHIKYLKMITISIDIPTTQMLVILGDLIFT